MYFEYNCNVYNYVQLVQFPGCVTFHERTEGVLTKESADNTVVR
jgi:hypothetical protein